VVSLPIVGWTDLALGPLAEAQLGLHVRIDNNANAAAFGEVYGDPEATGRPTLYLKIGTGVGGAVLLGGRPSTGAHGMAAELGHIKVPGPQLPCSCGRTGCLEPRINLAAFAAAARSVEPAFDGRPQGFAAVAARAPKAAAAMIEDYVTPLVSALATLCHVFDPAIIVLGGPLRPVLADAQPQLRQRLDEHLMRSFTPPELRVSKQGEYECAVGAAMLCHDAALAMGGRVSSMPSALRRMAS
jgi:predicted NBD/HSP70 family sugar kinase